MKENHKDEYKLYLDWVRYKLNQAEKYYKKDNKTEGYQYERKC